MIKSLTKEQEEKMEIYKNAGLEVGLSTSPTRRARAEISLRKCYENVNLTPPTTIFWALSPKQAVLIKAAALKNFEKTKTYLEEQGDNLTSEGLVSHMGLKQEDYNKNISDFGYGAQESYWLYFYKYFHEVCNLDLKSVLPLIDLAQDVTWSAFYDTFAILTEKPEVIKMSNKVLHNPKGPSIRFKDGFSVYSLNGIMIPPKYMTNPLTVSDIMRENNVDIRRELLRLIGLEQFCKETQAKVVDTFELETPVQSWPSKLESKYKSKFPNASLDVKAKINYRLLDITLSDGVTARVLEMENPSIDATHVEGVEDTCKTVKEALAWRLGLDNYEDLSALS